MKNQTYFTLENPRGSMRQFKKADNYLEQRVKYDTGYFDGNARSIPAIVMNGATENDLWYVVNLRDAVSNVFLQAIAVLGALDADQAIYAALQTFGDEYNHPTNDSVNVSEASYFALKRFLDIKQPFYGEITQDALNKCQAQVVKQPATWENDNITSHNGSMAALMHDMVQSDVNGELLDPVSKYDAVDMFIGDDGVIGTYDALITSYQRLDLLQERLATAMGKAAKGDDITLTGVTRSKPFKRNGVVNVAVIYELSDGQTISVIFHNPDSTPTKLSAQDTLTSWKWLLNKRDVSIVLQPKNGENVQLNQLAIRMLKLAHQNSARFKRTIAKRLENEKTLADMLVNKAELEKTEVALDAEIIDLQKQIDEKTKAVDLDLNGDKVSESNDSQLSSDPISEDELAYNEQRDSLFARIDSLDYHQAYRFAMYLGYLERTAMNADFVKELAKREHNDDLAAAFAKLDEPSSLAPVEPTVADAPVEAPATVEPVVEDTPVDDYAADRARRAAISEKIKKSKNRDDAYETALDLAIENPDLVGSIGVDLVDIVSTKKWEFDVLKLPKQPLKLSTAKEITATFRRLNTSLKDSNYSVSLLRVDNRADDIEISIGSKRTGLLSTVNEKLSIVKGDRTGEWKQFLGTRKNWLGEAVINWLNGDSSPINTPDKNYEWDLLFLGDRFKRDVKLGREQADMINNTPAEPVVQEVPMPEIEPIADASIEGLQSTITDFVENLLNSGIPAEPAPVEPAIEPVTGDEMADIAMDSKYENYIKIAADNINKLRGVDVERVLGESGLKDDDLVSLGNYIIANRLDLKEYVMNFFTGDPTADADTEYLQSIINGTADLATAGDDLERIGENLAPELEDLFEQAAEAYAQYAIAQAATI